MDWRMFCVLIQLLAPATALSCGAGYAGWNPTADACARIVALMTWKPSLASVATRNATGIGSTPMPVYSALGGPNGKGHVTFNRTSWQYMNTGQRPFNILSNGGFTVVAVVRFSVRLYSFDVIDDVILQGMSSAPEYEIFRLSIIYDWNYQYIRMLMENGEVWSVQLIVKSTDWMNITFTFASVTHIPSVWVNDKVQTGDTWYAASDWTLSTIIVGGRHDAENNNHYNGNIAGLFVTDELLSTEAITQVYNNIYKGVDLTTTCSIANACTACPAGRYKPATGTAACIDCATGKYSTTSAATTVAVCLDCVAGKYSNATVCIDCPTGKYSTALASTCTACTTGKYSTASAATAAAACLDCVAGKYADTPAAKSCIDCPSGTYSLALASTACTQCRANAKYTTSTLCECNPGYWDQTCGDYSQDNSCKSPAFNEWGPCGDHQLWCTYCCQTCTRLGKPCGRPRTCVECSAGKYDNANDIWTCIDCPANSFSAPAGAAISACLCNAGFTGPNGGACTFCVAGKYKSVSGSVACTPCPDNSNADSNSAAITACTCNVGFTGPNGDACIGCVSGKYKTVSGSAACTSCPDNSNASPSSQSVDACTCNAGFHGATADVCTPCAAGQYKSVAGNVDCLNCVAGSWSDTGALSCVSCPAYSDSPVSSPSVDSCVCNAGFYSANAGVCTLCVTGKYKSAPGNVDCMDCAAGSWSGIGAISCTPCPVYSMSPVSSQTIQACTCNIGFTGANGIACTACAAGTFKDTTGSALCTACPANTGASCSACTAARACTCNAGYIGGNFIGPYSSTACDRFIALIIQKRSFASVSTRNNTAIGSSVLPTYNALGGPNGYGHVTFDRSLSQFLNAGPRAWNVATNGGFTIVIILRFGAAYIDEQQLIFDATHFAVSDTPDTFALSMSSFSNAPRSLIFGMSSEVIIAEAVVVPGQWISVVITYSYDTHVTSMYLNNALANTVQNYKSSRKETDATLDAVYVGSYYTNPIMQSWLDSQHYTNSRLGKYFNGDIAGLFVVDELLSTAATTAIYDKMVLGYDFTNTMCPSGNTCTACPGGQYKPAPGTGACINCMTGKSTPSLATTSCVDCTVAKYASVDGLFCVRCPLYSTSPSLSASITACTCNTGFYGPNGGTCTALTSTTVSATTTPTRTSTTAPATTTPTPTSTSASATTTPVHTSTTASATTTPTPTSTSASATTTPTRTSTTVSTTTTPSPTSTTTLPTTTLVRTSTTASTTTTTTPTSTTVLATTTPVPTSTTASDVTKPATTTTIENDTQTTPNSYTTTPIAPTAPTPPMETISTITTVVATSTPASIVSTDSIDMRLVGIIVGASVVGSVLFGIVVYCIATR